MILFIYILCAVGLDLPEHLKIIADDYPDVFNHQKVIRYEDYLKMEALFRRAKGSNEDGSHGGGDTGDVQGIQASESDHCPYTQHEDSHEWSAKFGPNNDVNDLLNIDDADNIQSTCSSEMWYQGPAMVDGANVEVLFLDTYPSIGDDAGDAYFNGNIVSEIKFSYTEGIRGRWQTNKVSHDGSKFELDINERLSKIEVHSEVYVTKIIFDAVPLAGGEARRVIFGGEGSANTTVDEFVIPEGKGVMFVRMGYSESNNGFQYFQFKLTHDVDNDPELTYENALWKYDSDNHILSVDVRDVVVESPEINLGKIDVPKDVPEGQWRINHALELALTRWLWIQQHPEDYVNMLRSMGISDDDIQQVLERKKPRGFSEGEYVVLKSQLKNAAAAIEMNQLVADVHFIQRGSSTTGFNIDPLKGQQFVPTELWTNEERTNFLIEGEGLSTYISSNIRSVHHEARKYFWVIEPEQGPCKVYPELARALFTELDDISGFWDEIRGKTNTIQFSIVVCRHGTSYEPRLWDLPITFDEIV